MKIVALAGGVGGAKLADGLAQLLPSSDLTVIVNTGDDFEHLGLSISPDLDTVCYTLANLADPIKGWGRKDETWNFLESMKVIDGPTWFQIGDKDLATHIERTRRLHNSETLSEITRSFCKSWDIDVTILPMSDDPVRTMVHTQNGSLAFQDYFVAQRCEPKVIGFEFVGIDEAKPALGVIEAITEADAVIICPSNPWVSIDPILNLIGIRDLLKIKTVIAVSPIIQGKTIKGPAAKMYRDLGVDPSAVAVFNHYDDILSGFVIDELDADLAENINAPLLITNTIMKDRPDRIKLAEEIIRFMKGQKI